MNMKKNTLEHWSEFFHDRGISYELFEVYLVYIQKLISTESPIIFEKEHLSQLLGINESILNKMINSPNNFYRKFTIPKRRGGDRNIVAPYPSLLSCQHWIYKNILLTEHPHYSCHGFTPKKSIISNAKIHIGSKTLLKMDLEDFFPSIPINWVVRYFQQRGYANNVSFYLAALCCYDEHLAQGAATSPYLSNLLLKGLDERLTNLCLKYNLKYSRYADDLAISGDYVPHTLIEVITEIVSDYGLKVNTKKTALLINAQKKIITGIAITEDNIRVPRSFRRELKNTMNFILKYGFISHVTQLKIKDPYYLFSLIGKVNFLMQVEPENKNAREWKSTLINILKSQ
ncbi:reverse transcriptase family protein [Yersinia sp. 2466 StPb PI]|uniref:reverse transcriptase family protein n=1 Tax=Yersinia sp. 2466 StPb PI TaxID=3061648 RepID=UPI00355B09F3